METLVLHPAVDTINEELGREPVRLIEWALDVPGRPLVTTSFGPYSAVLLHMVTRVDPDVPVLWVDSGYGTKQTYLLAERLQRLLKLDLHTYRPLRSRAQREAVDGPMPALGDKRHAAFKREVKLEPFERGIQELRPSVWLTGVRAEETPHAQPQPVVQNPDGIFKVAPLLYWTTKQMNDYIKRFNLPNNFDYFDPTKVEGKGERAGPNALKA